MTIQVPHHNPYQGIYTAFFLIEKKWKNSTKKKNTSPNKFNVFIENVFVGCTFDCFFWLGPEIFNYTNPYSV